MRNWSLLIAGVLPLVAACSSSGLQHGLDAPVPSVWSSQSVSQGDAAGSSGDSWTAFEDAGLNRLIGMALTHNHSLKIAESNLVEARARHILARSQLFPDVSATAASSRSNPGLQSQNTAFNLSQGELDARYDIDLFGGNRQRSQAALQGEAAVSAQRNDVRLSVIAEVAAAFVSLRQVQQDLKDAKTISASADHIWQMRQAQQQAGLITDADLQSAFIASQQARSHVSRFEDIKSNLAAALSVLTGDDRFEFTSILDNDGPVPSAPASLIARSPIEVIRRRPDVVAAEHQLLATRAIHRAAIADTFPHLSISAFWGHQETSLLPAANVWSTTASLYLPLLNFGRLRAEVNASNAQEVAAYEGYRLAVIAALADVDVKFKSFNESRKRLAFTEAEYQAQMTAFNAAADETRKGLISSLALEAVQIDLTSSHMRLNDAEAEMALRYIALQKALAL